MVSVQQADSSPSRRARHTQHPRDGLVSDRDIFELRLRPWIVRARSPRSEAGFVVTKAFADTHSSQLHNGDPHASLGIPSEIIAAALFNTSRFGVKVSPICSSAPDIAAIEPDTLPATVLCTGTYVPWALSTRCARYASASAPVFCNGANCVKRSSRRVRHVKHVQSSVCVLLMVVMLALTELQSIPSPL